VPCCCSTASYGEFFDEKLARRDAERYRRRGPGRAGRRLVDLISARGVEGNEILEIGGGIGSLQLELLERGAARATNSELSPAYEREARALAREHGLEARVDRRIVNAAEDPDAVPAADVVLLHRVVCCYPTTRLCWRSRRTRRGGCWRSRIHPTSRSPAGRTASSICGRDCGL
jgi:magnesium-protoporphyrin O-methyltransferase